MPKKKANSHTTYYNCHKLRLFGRDCLLPDRQLNWSTQWQRNGQAGRKQSRGRTKNRNKSRVSNWAYQTTELSVDYNNLNQKLFATDQLRTAFIDRD